MKLIRLFLLLAVCCSIVYIGTRPAEKDTREKVLATDPNPMKVNPMQRIP